MITGEPRRIQDRMVLQEVTNSKVCNENKNIKGGEDGK
nr:MAG TPA: hypothetical protein [Caudoviricetes sp.]